MVGMAGAVAMVAAVSAGFSVALAGAWGAEVAAAVPAAVGRS